jgi:hypothetical protein
MLTFVKAGWENHSPFSPDLAPSDFHLFPKMKEFLSSKWMTTDEGLTDWLNGLAANCSDEGIVKLVQRLHKCPNHDVCRKVHIGHI